MGKWVWLCRWRELQVTAWLVESVLEVFSLFLELGRVVDLELVGEVCKLLKASGGKEKGFGESSL